MALPLTDPGASSTTPTSHRTVLRRWHSPIQAVNDGCWARFVSGAASQRR